VAVRWLTPSRLMAGLALGALLCSSACSPTVDSTGAPASSPSVSAAAPSPPDPSTSASSAPSTSVKPAAPRPEPTAAAKPSEKPTASTKPKPAEPAALMSRGDTGEQVRELQHRLRQLEWYSGTITGTYGRGTAEAVSGFQEKRKLDSSGRVDQKTWDKLVSMTKKPTRDERHNILRAGPAILERGDDGDRVRDLQARLKQIAWYSGKVTGRYGSATVSSVKGFQGKRAIPVTGEVDQRTLDRLKAMTRTPSRDEKHNIIPKPSARGLDPRCMTGRAMCVSKRTNQLVWVVDGEPQLRADVRFGSQELPTRNGAFRVGWKSRDHVSSIYKTPMPYAMFFSGGQAVHYSPDFAARGYSGASHGCVNVRNRGVIRQLFNTVRVGDKVIVYY
jgi:peptidoglycan hydrolase-like protein with peptidoglycan-binding domain